MLAAQTTHTVCVCAACRVSKELMRGYESNNKVVCTINQQCLSVSHLLCAKADTVALINVSGMWDIVMRLLMCLARGGEFQQDPQFSLM